MSLVTSPTRSRVKRAALVLSAGLFATTLAIGGGLAASAAPSILSASTATVNGYVTVTVSGFADSESLAINLDSTNLSYETADSTGAFTGSAFIPAGTSLGAHTISVVGTTSPTQSEAITIVAPPTASATPTTITASAFASTGVMVSFSGFASGASVQLGGGVGQSGGEIGTPVTADASGVVSATLRASDFKSAAGQPGIYSVVANTVDGSIISDVAHITVVADPAPAAPATPVKARASFTG